MASAPGPVPEPGEGLEAPPDADPRPVPDPEPGTRGRRQRWWTRGLMFVTGLVAGVLLVGLLRLGTPEFGALPATAPGAEPSVQPGAGPSVPVAAQAQVNAACLRVINAGQDVLNTLTGVDEAVTDVDLLQLDAVVRELQQIEPRLERDLRGCRVDTRVATASPAPPAGSPPAVSLGPDPSPSPAPTASR